MLHTKTVLSKHAKRLAKKADEHEQLIMKVTYSLGVLGFGLFCFMLGARPHDIPLLYAAFFIIAAPLRWVYYRAKKWHYFLLDFCYYANLICTFYLLFFSKSEKLFLLCFAFSEGPLAWALIVWRCSLVFSSVDKIVSVLIHLLPGTVIFIIRWWDPVTFTQHPVGDGAFGPWPAWPHVESSAKLWQWMFFVPLGVYVVWQLLYVAVVYGLRKQRILNDPEVLTSFRELSRKACRANNIWWRCSSALGEDRRFLMYAILQAVFTVATMALTVLMFLSYRFHAAFQIFKITASIWNGGNFFIEVMPRQMHAKATKKLSERQRAPKPPPEAVDGEAIEAAAAIGNGLVSHGLKAGEDEVFREEGSEEARACSSTGPLTRASTLGQASGDAGSGPGEKQSIAVSSLALEGSDVREDDSRPCRACGRCGPYRDHGLFVSEESDHFLPASSEALWMEGMSDWGDEPAVMAGSELRKFVSGQKGSDAAATAPAAAAGLEMERSIWKGANGGVACMG